MADIKEFKKGVKHQMTKNFYSSEMDCACRYPECEKTYVDLDHIKKLQRKRDKWGTAIEITSGYRCERYNREVGGATHSRHKIGDATDIKVASFTPDQVANGCEDFKGMGRYNTFTHLDSRPAEGKKKYRWDGRPKKR